MSAVLDISTNHIEMRDVGIRYCLTHKGTQNEDEDEFGNCNWREPWDQDAPCVFVELQYDESLVPVAEMLAGLAILLANEVER